MNRAAAEQESSMTELLDIVFMLDKNTSREDMVKSLNKAMTCLKQNSIFSSVMREQFFTPYGDFGLGVYLREENVRQAYYTVGGDFGVDFFRIFSANVDYSVCARKYRDEYISTIGKII